MHRETRTKLLIVSVVLTLGLPFIFAPISDAGTTYLPMAFYTPPTTLPTVTLGPTARPTRTTTPTITPKPTAAPTATPTLPPPTQNGCQADPNPSAAPHYPVRITNIDKQAETVTLLNTSTSPVDLTDWTMCSITGNQQHPIFGMLSPGQSVTFPGPIGNIWNNSSPDPGALYNPNGQLVSYFNS